MPILSLSSSKIESQNKKTTTEIRPRTWRRPLGLDDGPRQAVTQSHAELQPTSDLAILSEQRLMEEALTGLKRQGMPSTSAAAPGLLSSVALAFALRAFSAAWRDTTLGNTLPQVTTMVPITACDSLPDVRDRRVRVRFTRPGSPRRGDSARVPWRWCSERRDPPPRAPAPRSCPASRRARSDTPSPLRHVFATAPRSR